MGFDSFTIDTSTSPSAATLPSPAPSDDRVRNLLAKLRQTQRASYDAAKTTDEYKNYWANADAFDADSAHSTAVRHTLMRRSRYEIANNGYADGIAQTYATDLVGKGPQLRMMTGSQNFNQLIEVQWSRWATAVQFRRKLWCMAHAKHVDGEAFAVLRSNPRVRHPIKLDLVLHEAEQCQTPYLPFGEAGYIDGIKFDEFGNPLWFDFLKYHPGAMNVLDSSSEPERVPAEFVLHWFKMRRPGQHRGIPESASTLNLGAAFRRLREASLSTAEKVAAWTLFLKTMFQPDEMDGVVPMSTLEIVHGMMTALPNNVEPFQLSAEQPGPQYDTFHKSLLNEQARPKNMPFNKAACDSSSYNYASGRLDHQTYYSSLDVDREDGNDLALDPLFAVWMDSAIRTFNWFGGDPDIVSDGARAHMWDWPKHRVADVESEANANRTRLESAQVGLHQLYTDAGTDLTDELPKMAESFGITVEELQERILDSIFPPPKQALPATAKKPAAKPDEAVDAVLARVNGHAPLNGNGVHHATN